MPPEQRPEPEPRPDLEPVVKDIEELTQLVAGDRYLRVQLGRSGEGNYVDTLTRAIVFDPDYVEADPQDARIVGIKSGAHHAISVSPRMLGLSNRKVELLYGQLGFQFGQNTAEDLTAERWALDRYPGVAPLLDRVYEGEAGSRDAGIVSRVLEKFGLAGAESTPKFVQYASEVRRLERTGWDEVDPELDPDVREAIEATRDTLQKVAGKVPKQRSFYRSLISARRRLIDYQKDIWPHLQSLIQSDVEQEALRQFGIDSPVGGKKQSDEGESSDQATEGESQDGDEQGQPGESQDGDGESGEGSENAESGDGSSESPDSDSGADSEGDGSSDESDPQDSDSGEGGSGDREDADEPGESGQSDPSENADQTDSGESGDSESDGSSGSGEDESSDPSESGGGSGENGGDPQGGSGPDEEGSGGEGGSENAEADRSDGEGSGEDPSNRTEETDRSDQTERDAGPQGDVGPSESETASEADEEQQLRDRFEDLPEEERERLMQQAEERLKELEDELNQEFFDWLDRGDLPSHGELAETPEVSGTYRPGTPGGTELAEYLRQDEDLYDQLYREVSPVIQELYRLVEPFFRASRNPRWQRGYTSGQRVTLDSVMQSKGSGVPRLDIWERRALPERRDYAFSVLLDLSSSMNEGSKLLESQKGLIVLLETFELLGVRTELHGFRGGGYESDSVFQLKHWDDPLDNELRRQVSEQLYGSGGTPTLTATETAYKSLQRERAKHRFLVTITDGWPNDPDSTKAFIDTVAEAGDVGLLGIGLGDDSEFVSQYYPASLYLPEVSMGEGEVESFAEKLAHLMEQMIFDPERFREAAKPSAAEDGSGL